MTESDLISKPRRFPSQSIEDWQARKWTLPQLAEQFSSTKGTVRFHRRCKRTVLESECDRQETTLRAFSDWVQGKSETDITAPRSDSVAYLDYQHLSELFAEDEAYREAALGMSWSRFLPPTSPDEYSDGSQSTLWVGTEGAHTRLHYDTYGHNLVAQLDGHKVPASSILPFPRFRTTAVFTSRFLPEMDALSSQPNRQALPFETAFRRELCVVLCRCDAARRHPPSRVRFSVGL